MHVVSEKKLRDFWAEYPESRTPLRSWHRVAEHANWTTFSDVRAIYPGAKQVGKLIVFEIGGNKFRLAVAIHFNRGKLFIRHVMTHKEYDEGKWKED